VQSLIQGAGMQGSFLVTIDWDGDGVDEIVMGPNTVTNLAAPMRWARNLGGLQFAVTPTGDFGIALIPDTQTGAAVTDLDGNGVAEFVLVERGDTWSLVFLEPDRSGATRIGSACGAPAPVLTAVGTPSRGNINFACDLTGGQPNGAALLWIGASQRTLFGQAILPIELSPFGAPGCWLRTEPTSLAAAACDAVGSARWVLPIPNDPALLRATAFLQCAVPQAGANPAQLVLSAALAVRIR